MISAHTRSCDVLCHPGINWFLQPALGFIFIHHTYNRLQIDIIGKVDRKVHRYSYIKVTGCWCDCLSVCVYRKFLLTSELIWSSFFGVTLQSFIKWKWDERRRKVGKKNPTNEIIFNFYDFIWFFETLCKVPILMRLPPPSQEK